MNSESGQRLSMEELKQRNTSQSMVPQICLSQEAWQELLRRLDALERHTEAHTALLREVIGQREQFPTQGEDFPRVYERVCHAVDRLLAQMPASQYGLVGMGVAVHGVVDLSGLIRFIPRRGWRNVDLRSRSKELNALINGRGGGKPRMIQGSASASAERISAALERDFR